MTPPTPLITPSTTRLWTIGWPARAAPGGFQDLVGAGAGIDHAVERERRFHVEEQPADLGLAAGPARPGRRVGDDPAGLDDGRRPRHRGERALRAERGREGAAELGE